MSTALSPETTPQTVAEHATERVHLPRLALLGVFGTSQHLAALVRTKSGQIARVSTGDTVAGGIVVTIGEAQLVLKQRNRTKVLRLPEV